MTSRSILSGPCRVMCGEARSAIRETATIEVALFDGMLSLAAQVALRSRPYPLSESGRSIVLPHVVSRHWACSFVQDVCRDPACIERGPIKVFDRI